MTGDKRLPPQRTTTTIRGWLTPWRNQGGQVETTRTTEPVSKADAEQKDAVEAGKDRV